MAQESKIQWTNATFNPWRGCTRVSQGCKFCYAETLSARNPKVLGVWGQHGTRVLAAENYWRTPMTWQRKAAKSGTRFRVFCCSLADVFEDWPGQMTDTKGRLLWYHPATDTPVASDECPSGHVPYQLVHARNRLWGVVEATPHLDWQLLTKRPENMHYQFVPQRWEEEGWPNNAWAMTSVEDQPNADRRLPALKTVSARIRGLSVEPLLGPVQLHDAESIGWAIIGGESGHGARKMEWQWALNLIAFCAEVGIPCFFKQAGSVLAKEWGCKDGHGGFMEEWPDFVPRIRQFPR